MPHLLTPVRKKYKSYPFVLKSCLWIFYHSFVTDGETGGRGFIIRYKKASQFNSSGEVTGAPPATGCGISPASSPGRIIGGVDAGPGDWPWMVEIFLNQVFVCSGVLISMWISVYFSQCTVVQKLTRLCALRQIANQQLYWVR